MTSQNFKKRLIFKIKIWRDGLENRNLVVSNDEIWFFFKNIFGNKLTKY